MAIFNSYVKLPEGNDGGMTIYGMTIPEKLDHGLVPIWTALHSFQPGMVLVVSFS